MSLFKYIIRDKNCIKDINQVHNISCHRLFVRIFELFVVFLNTLEFISWLLIMKRLKQTLFILG